MIKKRLEFNDLRPGNSYIVKLKGDPKIHRIRVFDKLETTVKTMQGGGIRWRHINEFSSGEIQIVGVVTKRK